ncbi:MAG: hypothetical protein RG741_04855 [Bacteroidales bacterium]|nr:hypothetical protein [Bacteroidales bacterium]
MMQETFLHAVKHRRFSDDELPSFLGDVVKKFPYCQPALILYAKVLMHRGHPGYEEVLKRAEACVPDQRLFRAFMAEEERHTPAGNTPETPEMPEAQVRQQRQQAIIERFLTNQPRIQRAGAPAPTGELSRESIEEKSDIVSETLAEVLLKQGQKDRAIMIYNKLSLMFPEKSRYFAKKLKNIEKGNF